MIYESPIFNLKSLLKGFLAASFLILGLFTDFAIPIRLVILIIGFLILIDSFITFGKQPYIIISSAGVVIGAIITFITIFTKLSGQYLALVFILAVLLYFTGIHKTYKKIKRK